MVEMGNQRSRAHDDQEVEGVIVKSRRDRRVIDWMVAQVGKKAVSEACGMLAGHRKPYVSNLAKVLGLTPPFDLSLAPKEDATRYLAQCMQIVQAKRIDSTADQHQTLTQRRARKMTGDIEPILNMVNRLRGTGGGEQVKAVADAIRIIQAAPGMLDMNNRITAIWHLTVALAGESRAKETLQNAALRVSGSL